MNIGKFSYSTTVVEWGMYRCDSWRIVEVLRMFWESDGEVCVVIVVHHDHDAEREAFCLFHRNVCTSPCWAYILDKIILVCVYHFCADDHCEFAMIMTDCHDHGPNPSWLRTKITMIMMRNVIFYGQEYLYPIPKQTLQINLNFGWFGIYLCVFDHDHKTEQTCFRIMIMHF